MVNGVQEVDSLSGSSTHFLGALTCVSVIIFLCSVIDMIMDHPTLESRVSD